MCYCQNGDEALKKSIADAETKIEQLKKLMGSGAARTGQPGGLRPSDPPGGPWAPGGGRGQGGRGPFR